MQSKASTVEQYLSEMPEERRAAIAVVRHVILKNLDKDYEEGMQHGMIGYYVPHRVYPAGYHANPKQPLPFASLASQKDHMSLHMMPIYGEGAEESWFRNEWAKTGKKLDMGKCCISFKHLEDLALNVIGEAIRRVPATRFIEHYESVLKSSRPKNSKLVAAKLTEKPTSKTVSKGKTKTSSAKPAAAKSTSGKSAAAKPTASKTAKTSKTVTVKKPVKKAPTKPVSNAVTKKATPKKKAAKR